MKQTSIDCYYELKKTDYLTRKEKAVLEAIKAHTITSAEAVSQDDINAIIPHGRKRMAELERKGCIAPVGTTKSHKSGKQVTTYMWVSDTPRPVEKKKTRYDEGYHRGWRDCLAALHNKYILPISEDICD